MTDPKQPPTRPKIKWLAAVKNVTAEKAGTTIVVIGAKTPSQK